MTTAARVQYLELQPVRVPLLDPYSALWRNLWIGTVLVVLAWFAQVILAIDSFAAFSNRGTVGVAPGSWSATAIVVWVLSAAGYWLFTTSDGSTEPFGVAVSRIAVRVCLVCSLLLSSFAYMQSTSASPMDPAAAAPLAVLKILCETVEFFAFLWVCRWTALRLNAMTLSRYAVLCMWLIPALGVLGLVLIMTVVFKVVLAQSPPDLSDVPQGRIMFALVPIALASVAYVVLVGWVSARLFGLRCRDQDLVAY